MNTKKINKSPAGDWLLIFKKSLNISDQNKVKGIYKDLKPSQNLLWEALNIYDDCFDQAVKAKELPRANNYFRQYLKIHSQLKLPDDYYILSNRLFNKLDKKNYREINESYLKIKNNKLTLYNNLPCTRNLENLSDKSLALSLSIVALFFYLDSKNKKIEIKHILNFFKYFLAAKQLSDDSQDWLSDLKNESISEANLPILLAIKKAGLKLDLNKDTETLNLLYINEASLLINQDLKCLCLKARRTLKKVKSINYLMISNKLLEPIERACKKADNFRSLVLEN